MKKIFISAMLALVATTTAFAQNRAERLSLDDPGSFSMILLGDPQTYLKYKINQPIFDLMTCWFTVHCRDTLCSATPPDFSATESRDARLVRPPATYCFVGGVRQYTHSVSMGSIAIAI